MKTRCDGCQIERNDVRSCGKDSNGDADAPDLCFLCRKEQSRGKFYNVDKAAYVRPYFEAEFSNV